MGAIMIQEENEGHLCEVVYVSTLTVVVAMPQLSSLHNPTSKLLKIW